MLMDPFDTFRSVDKLFPRSSRSDEPWQPRDSRRESHAGFELFHDGGYSFRFNERAPYGVMFAIARSHPDLVTLEPLDHNIGIYRVKQGYIEWNGSRFYFYYEGDERELVLDDFMISWVKDADGRELWLNAAPTATTPEQEPAIEAVETGIELNPTDFPQLQVVKGIRIYVMPNGLIKTQSGPLKTADGLSIKVRVINRAMRKRLKPGGTYVFDPPLWAPHLEDLKRGVGRLVAVDSCRYLRFDHDSERHILAVRQNGEEIVLAAFIAQPPKQARG